MIRWTPALVFLCACMVNETSSDVHEEMLDLGPVVSNDAAGDQDAQGLSDEGDIHGGEQSGVSYGIEFITLSTAFWGASSLAVTPDGNNGIMGMSYGTGTCEYNPDTGQLGSEDNSTDCDDEVLFYTWGGQAVVAGFECEMLVYGDSEVEIAGLLNAEVYGEGFVTLERGDISAPCQITRHTGADVATSTAVSSGICAQPKTLMTTDPEAGRVFIATGEDLWSVGETDAEVVATDVAHAAVDRNTGDLMVAAYGAEEVRMLTAEGEELWTLPLEGTVAGVRTLGTMGLALVHVLGEGDMPGTFVTVHLEDGQVWAEHVAWPNVNDWDVSADGSTFSVAAGSNVYTYGVRLVE